MPDATVERIDGKLLAVLHRGAHHIYAANLATLRTDDWERPAAEQLAALRPGDVVPFRDIPETEGCAVEVEVGGQWWIARTGVYLAHDRRTPLWEAAEAAEIDEENLLP
jgi:hypothetical protein